MTDEARLRDLIAEQDAYRRATPALVSRTVRKMARPVALLTNRMIPPEAVEVAIRGADWAASASIRRTAIDHDFRDIDACEAAAADIRRWALGYAVAGGGAAGAFGVIGLAADVPATIALALRTVRLTGLCYGFGADTEDERIFILECLALAGANDNAERRAAISRLEAQTGAASPDAFGRVVRLTGQTAGAQAAVTRVAKMLGVNLSARKIGQVTPVLGAAIGAGVNAAFQNDVAAAARFAYRERWLAVNEKIIPGTLVEKADGE